MVAESDKELPSNFALKLSLTSAEKWIRGSNVNFYWGGLFALPRTLILLLCAAPAEHRGCL